LKENKSLIKGIEVELNEARAKLKQKEESLLTSLENESTLRQTLDSTKAGFRKREDIWLKKLSQRQEKLEKIGKDNELAIKKAHEHAQKVYTQKEELLLASLVEEESLRALKRRNKIRENRETTEKQNCGQQEKDSTCSGNAAKEMNKVDQDLDSASNEEDQRGGSKLSNSGSKKDFFATKSLALVLAQKTLPREIPGISSSQRNPEWLQEVIRRLPLANKDKDGKPPPPAPPNVIERALSALCNSSLPDLEDVGIEDTHLLDEAKALTSDRTNSKIDIIKNLSYNAKTLLCIAITLGEVSEAWKIISCQNLRRYCGEEPSFDDTIEQLKNAGLLSEVQRDPNSMEIDEETRFKVGVQMENVEGALSDSFVSQPFFKALVGYVRKYDIDQTLR